MFGYSNDWFYANESAVNPLSRGDISNNVVLLDDGTALERVLMTALPYPARPVPCCSYSTIYFPTCQ